MRTRYARMATVAALAILMGTFSADAAAGCRIEAWEWARGEDRVRIRGTVRCGPQIIIIDSEQPPPPEQSEHPLDKYGKAVLTISDATLGRGRPELTDMFVRYCNLDTKDYSFDKTVEFNPTVLKEITHLSIELKDVSTWVWTDIVVCDH